MDILQGSDATEARWIVDNSGENHEGIGEIERGTSNSEEDTEWLQYWQEADPIIAKTGYQSSLKPDPGSKPGFETKSKKGPRFQV